MPDFVLNRNYVLAGPGQMINFVKGKPTYVPPIMVRDALGIGAEPVDGPIDALGPEEAEEKVYSAVEKEELFTKIFDAFAERNDSAEFDGAGIPQYEALRRALPFPFTKKERNAAWHQYNEKKASQ